MSKNKTSFAQTLENLRHGTVAEEIDELLTEALQATADTGKQSKVTISLTIKPNGNGVYKIMDDVNQFFLSSIKNQLFYSPMENSSLFAKIHANRN